MDIISNGKFNLLSPAVANRDEVVVLEMFRQIDKHTDKSYVIDMTGVVSCVNRFFVMLSELVNSDISLVNVDSRILSALYLTGFDKYVKIYGDEVSLEENRNQLINRRMCLCR